MGFWKKHFSSKHLDSGDLAENQKAAIKIVHIGDGDVDETDGVKKMLIRFAPGTEFGKTCKKTTWLCSLTVGYQLAAMFGDDDANWIGKIIVVYAAKIRDGESVRIFGSPEIKADVSCKVRDFGGKKTWTMKATGAAKKPTDTSPSDSATPPGDA